MFLDRPGPWQLHATPHPGSGLGHFSPQFPQASVLLLQAAQPVFWLIPSLFSKHPLLLPCKGRNQQDCDIIASYNAVYFKKHLWRLYHTYSSSPPHPLPIRRHSASSTCLPRGQPGRAGSQEDRRVATYVHVLPCKGNHCSSLARGL